MRRAVVMRFVAAALLVFTGLTAVGVGLAWTLVPAPLDYHRTGYFEFAMPKTWSCDLEGGETVCFPAGVTPHDSIIVLAAKWRNRQDDRQAYLVHLGTPKVITTKDGNPITSRVVHAREIEIGGHRWVDGLHFESEIPKFYTRYLATITSHLGVLITFSVHETAFDKRMQDLDKAVASLRIYEAPSPFN